MVEMIERDLQVEGNDVIRLAGVEGSRLDTVAIAIGHIKNSDSLAVDFLKQALAADIATACGRPWCEPVVELETAKGPSGRVFLGGRMVCKNLTHLCPLGGRGGGAGDREPLVPKPSHPAQRVAMRAARPI